MTRNASTCVADSNEWGGLGNRILVVLSNMVLAHHYNLTLCIHDRSVAKLFGHVCRCTRRQTRVLTPAALRTGFVTDWWIAEQRFSPLHTHITQSLPALRMRPIDIGCRIYAAVQMRTRYDTFVTVPRVGEHCVFVTADNYSTERVVQRAMRKRGHLVHTASRVGIGRSLPYSNAAANKTAILHIWRILAQAHTLVYTRRSTFGLTAAFFAHRTIAVG